MTRPSPPTLAALLLLALTITSTTLASRTSTNLQTHHLERLTRLDQQHSLQTEATNPSSRFVPLAQRLDEIPSSLLQEAASALTQALLWVMQNTDKANVNLLYGVQCVRGSLPQLVEPLQAMVDAMKETAKQSDATFEALQGVVAEPQLIEKEKPLPSLEDVDAPQPSDWTKKYEHFSDRCIHGALTCRVPHKCLRRYARPSKEGGYRMTHKLLFFKFAQASQCSLSIDAAAAVKQLVAQTFIEQQASREYSDLFAERVGLCAHYGYSECLQRAWIKQIIDAQYGSGCWNDDDDDPQHERCDTHTTSVSMIPLAAYLHFAGFDVYTYIAQSAPELIKQSESSDANSESST